MLAESETSNMFVFKRGMYLRENLRVLKVQANVAAHLTRLLPRIHANTSLQMDARSAYNSTKSQLVSLDYVTG